MAWKIRDGGNNPQKDVYFWLEMNDGDLVLHCANDPENDADDWVVLAITEKGYLKLADNLDPALGMVLNPDDETIMLKDELF